MSNEFNRVNRVDWFSALNRSTVEEAIRFLNTLPKDATLEAEIVRYEDPCSTFSQVESYIDLP